MSPGRRRAIAVLAVLTAGAVAWTLWQRRDGGHAPGARPISPEAGRVLPGLIADPHRLPPAPTGNEATVMLLLGIDDDGDVAVDGPPIELAPSSLRFARAITRRRTAAPPMWVLVRDPRSGEVRYWVPLNPSDAIRVNIRDADEDVHHQGALERIPEMYQTVRLPFRAGAIVEFVRADATGAGTYRFGARPTDPLERGP